MREVCVRPLDPVKSVEWPWCLDIVLAKCTLGARDGERCLVDGTVAGCVSDGGRIRGPEGRCGWGGCTEAIGSGNRACRVAVAMAQHDDDRGQGGPPESSGLLRSVAPDGLGVVMMGFVDVKGKGVRDWRAMIAIALLLPPHVDSPLQTWDASNDRPAAAACTACESSCCLSPGGTRFCSPSG